MKTIDIVLPVYNEEEGIAAFHAALFRILDPHRDRYRFRVIYVVDHSTDNTFGILKDLAADSPEVTVLHLSRRFGHQAALIAGMDSSQGDAVIMMDCDFEHPIETIPLLLERFEQGFDIVHAVRKYGDNAGFPRKVASRLFYAVQNSMSPVRIHNGAADFRLLSRKVVVVFQTAIREHNQFLRGLFHWVGFRSTTVDFVSRPRLAGYSKYDFSSRIAFSLHGLMAFSKVPLRLASLIGVGMSCFSLLYGIWLLVEYFRMGDFPRGYTSLILAVLFLGGLHFIVMGVIGEYIGSIFDEVKGRPLYLVDETVQGSHR